MEKPYASPTATELRATAPAAYSTGKQTVVTYGLTATFGDGSTKKVLT